LTDEPAPAPVADNAPAPAPSWRDSLPEDIKASPTLAKFETIEGLSKSYVNLEKMLGTEKVPIPKEGDTAGWDAYYKAGGRPDTPDAYGFKKPDTLPEGIEYSEEMDKKFAAEAHKHGLSAKQAAALRDWQLGVLSEGAKAQAAQADVARADGEAKLKQAWGQAYNDRMKDANVALKEYGSPEFTAFLESSNLGNHPAMAEFLYKVASKTIGEQKLVGERNQPAQTPADIDAAIADHAKLHQAALFDSSHPEHALRVRERTALFDKKFGNG
jgi:hypothetical protein